jgi:hypothetical protein
MAPAAGIELHRVKLIWWVIQLSKSMLLQTGVVLITALVIPPARYAGLAENVNLLTFLFCNLVFVVFLK